MKSVSNYSLESDAPDLSRTANFIKLLSVTVDGVLLLNEAELVGGVRAASLTAKSDIQAKDIGYWKTLNLNNAKVSGNLSLSGMLHAESKSAPTEPGENQINLANASVEGWLDVNVMIQQPCELNIHSVTIGGDASICVGVHGQEHGVTKPVTTFLQCNDLKVAGNLRLKLPSNSTVTAWCVTIGTDLSLLCEGAKNIEWILKGATVGNLVNSNGKGWGETPIIRAVDLTYQSIRDDDGSEKVSLAWLKYLSPYQASQPYLQLAKVLSANGHDEQSRNAIDKMKWAGIRYALGEPFAGKPWFLQPIALIEFLAVTPIKIIIPALFGLLFRFGLSPSRAAGTMIIFIGIGWGGALYALQNNLLALRLDPVANQVVSNNANPVVGIPISTGPTMERVACGDAVSPMWYAVDTFIPLIDLKQESECVPQVEGRFQIPSVLGVPMPSLDTNSLRWIVSIYALIGAVITSLTVLTFSGILKGSLKE